MIVRLRVVIGFTLALLIFVTGPGAGATAGYQNLPGWNWVAGGALRGVSFVSGTTGWAVGDGGLIIHSTDGGATWAPQTSSTKDVLYDVQFMDSDNGWAVGEGGTIVFTSNGGTNWNTQTTPTSEDLHRVRFVSTSRGWAVGDGGTIIATTDGGTNWNSQTSNTTKHLYGVDFVDTTHGWAVGQDGTVIATTDGGTNWGVQTCSEIHDLYDVDFVDLNNGWIVGWGSALWVTSSGGSIWGEHIYSGWTRNLYAADFIDSSHGWTAGAASFIATWSGTGWYQQGSENADINLYGVDFVDSQSGWAVGDGGTVLSTTDGGTTWAHRIGTTSMGINGLYFIDRDRGWAAAGASVAGFPGELWYTSDGGDTWTIQKSGVSHLNEVQFLTKDYGWAVGGGPFAGNTILHTIDSGQTWTSQDNPGWKINAVSFADVSHGWVVGGGAGSNGCILNTTNGGDDWTLQKTISSVPLYDVCFSDSNRGWAAGEYGNIWATINGSVWFTQTSGTTATLFSLYFWDQLGWAVGDHGTILATRDRGDTWVAQDSGYPDATFFDVDFSGPAWGWVVGVDDNGDNLLLATGDLGTTWLQDDISIDAPLTSVHAFRHGRGPLIWAGGSNGLIVSNHPDPTVPVSGTVTPGEGGYVFPSDGSTILIFPSGAVTATTTVTYTPQIASEVPSTGDLDGFLLFDLTAVYSGTTTPASLAPSAEYTVSASYAGELVAEDSQLGLYWWSGSAWDKEATSSADYDLDVVTANPDHFSYFGLLGNVHRIRLPAVLKRHQ